MSLLATSITSNAVYVVPDSELHSLSPDNFQNKTPHTRTLKCHLKINGHLGECASVLVLYNSSWYTLMLVNMCQLQKQRFRRSDCWSVSAFVFFNYSFKSSDAGSCSEVQFDPAESNLDWIWNWIEEVLPGGPHYEWAAANRKGMRCHSRRYRLLSQVSHK